MLMMITKCVRFKTIRERINMAERDIKNKDYLLNIEKDIHWFSIGCLIATSYFTSLYVNIFEEHEEGRKRSIYDIIVEEWDTIPFLLRLLGYVFYVKQAFFEAGPFRIHKSIRFYIAYSILLNIYTLFRFKFVKEDHNDFLTISQ
jgi:hypothetical protein